MRTIHLDNDNEVNEFIIENLKEENKKLKAELDLLEDNRIYLNDKIYKAIEYIENNKQIAMFADLRKEGTHQYTIECDADDLLDILKGGNNE